MSQHPFDAPVPFVLDPKTRQDIADTVPIPHSMPARPFSSVRALWLCRAEGCSWWNAPERIRCKECGGPRAE